MADWQTISSLATAGGTLVLALATFSAVRSSNRSARVAEEALLTGMRPLLIPSLSDDPVQKLLWSDLHLAKLAGGRGLAEAEGDVIYVGISLRNVGAGIALLHGWSPIDQAFGALPARRPGRLPSPHRRLLRRRRRARLLPRRGARCRRPDPRRDCSP